MNKPLLPSTNLWSIDTGIYSFSFPRVTVDLKALAEFKSQTNRATATVRGSTAIIDVLGPIEKRHSMVGEFFGFASSEAIRMGVQQALADESIDTILLRVDSPGGAVDGLAEASDAIFEARQHKTVIAQVDGMAASAAFHIASQANQVFAGRTDLVGSIGTVLSMVDVSKALEDQGVEVVQFKTGPLKGAGEFGTEITPEQRENFQALVDTFFDDFLKTVSRGREMTVAEVKKSASGEVFVAPEAKRRGLIDKIQTMDQTLEQLEKRAQGRGRMRRARAALALAGVGP